MKAKVKDIFSLVFTWLLGVLGLSGCSQFVCMYGCPYSDFVMKGVVTDVDSEPIKGIKVTLQYVNPETGESYDRTTPVYSDETGAVHFHDGTSMIFGEEVNMKIHLEDVDGLENGGEFISKDIEANIIKTGNGSGSWDEGSFECTFKASLEKARTE